MTDPFRDPTELSAQDVAKAIAIRQDRHGYAKALRQVQHWTDKRLLKTTSKIKIGTGRSRTYAARHTLPVAAILQELTLLRFTIADLRPVARFLNGESGGPEDSYELRDAMRARGSYLVLGYDVDPKGRRFLRGMRLYDAVLHQTQREAFQTASRNAVLIKLGPVFGQIKWPA